MFHIISISATCLYCGHSREFPPYADPPRTCCVEGINKDGEMAKQQIVRKAIGLVKSLRDAGFPSGTIYEVYKRARFDMDCINDGCAMDIMKLEARQRDESEKDNGGGI